MARSIGYQGSGRLRAIRATAGGAWIRSASLSDGETGPVECVARSGELIGPGQRLLVVADAGPDEAASERCIAALRAGFHASGGDLPERLRKGLTAAQRAALRAGGPDSGGVSLIALATGWDLQGCLARVGATRAYRLRAGGLSALGTEQVDGSRLGLAPDLEVEISPFDVEEGDHLVLGSAQLAALPHDDIARALALPGPFAAASRLIQCGRRLALGPHMTVSVATIGERVAEKPAPREPEGPRRSARPARVAVLAAALVACGLVADRLHTPTTAD